MRSTIGRAGDAVASAAGAVGQGAFGVAAAVAAALQLRQVCAAAFCLARCATTLLSVTQPTPLGQDGTLGMPRPCEVLSALMAQ